MSFSRALIVIIIVTVYPFSPVVRPPTQNHSYLKLDNFIVVIRQHIMYKENAFMNVPTNAATDTNIIAIVNKIMSKICYTVLHPPFLRLVLR